MIFCTKCKGKRLKDMAMDERDIYVSRYRKLGKELEMERLRISQMMNGHGKGQDKQKMSQGQTRDKSNEILAELNELEDLLFTKGD